MIVNSYNHKSGGERIIPLQGRRINDILVIAVALEVYFIFSTTIRYQTSINGATVFIKRKLRHNLNQAIAQRFSSIFISLKSIAVLLENYNNKDRFDYKV